MLGSTSFTRSVNFFSLSAMRFMSRALADDGRT
jgi:hypothetical protein